MIIKLVDHFGGQTILIKSTHNYCYMNSKEIFIRINYMKNLYNYSLLI